MVTSIGNAIPPAPVTAPQSGGPVQYGLFSAARMREDVPRHQLNGVEYEPVCSTVVHEWPQPCGWYRPWHTGAPGYPEPMPHFGPDQGPDKPYGRKRFEHSTGVTRAAPFAVYAGEDCFLGNHDQSQALADLKERFRLGEQATVERVVYHGLMGVTPAIRYEPEVITTGGVFPEGQQLVGVLDGIGLLEQWLAAESGATGVIHLPRFMAAQLGGGQALRTSGQRAVTELGNTLVFGTGYDGSAPFHDEGTVPEQPDRVWLYATRPVTVRRSDLLVPATYQTGAVSLPRDEASLLVERNYVVDWPCAVAAIQVDFPRYRIGTEQVRAPSAESADSSKEQ